MSEAPHEAPIKTPGQLIAVVIAAFAIPIVVIILLATYANHVLRTGAGTDSLADGAVAQRIAPLAQVDVKDASAPRAYKTGAEVYKAVCATCHGNGTAGAPKFSNAAEWAPRIAQGYGMLLHIALTGKGAMLPRGGTSPDEYSDYEIARTVVYMANQAGATFTEPAAPAANAPAAASGVAASSEADAITAASAQVAATIAAIGKQPPAGTSATSPSADATQAGKALYTQVCQTCHAAGLLNAPKFGDKAAWAPRLKDGSETIYNYALHGKGAMPPKGGSNASDADVKAAVDYMMNAAK